MLRTNLSLFVATLLVVAAPVSANPAQRLGEAVRIKTVSYQDTSRIDYSQLQQFHRFLRASYPRVFSQLSVEVINNYSLLIRWPGSDSSLAPILFTAHMDVVPVEPGTDADWQRPPFAGVVADGRIYGRGTLDDKEGLLGVMEAAEQLLAEGFAPRRTIVLAFGHDEEIGGRQGAASIAARMRQLGLHFDWMVDEGGMLISDNPMLPDRPMAMINIAEKGYLTLILTATGDGGHSSNPPKISTIGRLSAALTRIENSPFPPRLVGPVRDMLGALAPYVGQPERFAFNNLWLAGGYIAGQMADNRLTMPFVRTTTALTMFNAGVKENVVPQRAEARVNFRLLPGDTPEGIIEQVTAMVDDPAITITHDTWNNIPGVADVRGAGFTVLAKAVNAVYPQAVIVPSLLMATTDTRHYIDLVDNQYRFHGIMVASAQARSVHGTDEYVDESSYNQSIEVARQMMQLGAQ